MSDDQKIQIVCGAQFGSEGKGAVAAWLASRDDEAICVRVGGPNAGHTVVAPNGKTYKLQHLPTGAVHGNSCYLAAGSEIDLDILYNEIATLEADGIKVASKLLIDRNATVLEDTYAEAESRGQPHGEAGLTKRIGSTGKGVGAARSARIWREAKRICDIELVNIPTGETAVDLAEDLRSGQGVIIEGTQGYGLGLHTNYYPFCTSGDCRAIDFLAQCGLNPWTWGIPLQVWVVARTFPIRVAGNSGPMGEEISWEQIGVAPEQTTVTKKQRRVAKFDPELVREAIFANGGYHCSLVLNFLDYVYPDLRHVSNHAKIIERAGGYIDEMELELGIGVTAVGTGPSTIVELEV